MFRHRIPMPAARRAAPLVAAIAVLALLAIAATPGPAHAATVTVTTSADAIDINWQTGTIADLPGPDGRVSFSEAMIATNHTPGADVIAFAVPRSEWTMQWLYPGRAVLVTTGGTFWQATDQVAIDGATQTAFSGDTNPDGNEVATYGGTIYLNAGGCTFTGFDMSSVYLTGSDGRIEGNTGGLGIDLYGGSGSTVRNNNAGYIKIDRSNDNVVVGNVCNRLRVLGWVGGGLPARNNRVGGPDPADGNVVIGQGTWSSEGYPSGYALQLFDTDGTLVQNNRIGTTADGLGPGHAATTVGVTIEDDNRNLTVRDNQVAGILARGIGPHFYGYVGTAIYMTGTVSGLRLTRNRIGLNALGEPVLGSVNGIEVGTWNYVGMSDLAIGDGTAGGGNLIAGHRATGIVVGWPVPALRIAGNRIYGNAGLGIDLVTPTYQYGVTPNDPLDPDSGANGLQNFPEIASAAMTSSGLRAAGSLRSAASSRYTVEFFASPACDSLGYGEGETFLGGASLVTDASGNAPFNLTLPVVVEPGWVLTATATLEPSGATSEFSACASITDERTASVEAAEAENGAGASAGTADLRISPSPFHDRAVIHYSLARPGAIELAIYDASGRAVRRLESAVRPAGPGMTSWDARDDAGRIAAPGVYFCRLTGPDATLTRRFVRVR